MARTVSDFDLTPQRGENTQINWGQVATDFSSKIRAEITKREARKKAISDDYAKQAEKLSDIAESEDFTVQAQLVKASQASMRELSDRYDLVKNGLLSPEDFTLFQTNQKADYKTTSMLMKGLGKWAVDTRGSIENQTATNQTIFIYDYLTKYAGLNGVDITTGKDGRIVYKTKKNLMTTEEAKRILAEQRTAKEGEVVLPGAISDEDAKAYVKTNPIYGDEFSDDRGDTIGVQDLYNLFNYRGDPGVVVDTTGAVKEQVDVMGQYIRSYFNDVTGVTTTMNDFRNAPGTTDKTPGGAYRESLQILQDKLATSEGEIVQVLTNLGGYQLALSAQDAKNKYGDDVELSKIIYMNYDNGVVTYTNMEGKKAIADKVLDSEFNRQLDSSTTSSAPNVSYLNREERLEKETQLISGIGQDIKNIMSGTSATASATSYDRIEDMNDRLAKDGIRINSIKRDGESIVISRTFTDQYNRPIDMTITIDNTGKLSQKDIGRKIYRAIVPKEILDNYAYEGFLDLLEREENFSFEPRMIKDPNDSTKMIPNPNYKGSEVFETQESITVIPPYQMSTDGFGEDDNTFALFDTIPETGKNFKQAAPVVEQAYTRALSSHGIPVSVSTEDPRMSGNNKIIVTYKDPITNNTATKIFIFKKDKVKLRGEVNVHINSLIDKLNQKRGQGGGGGGGAPSDKRLKENIKLVGQSPNGVNIYNWNYKSPEQYGEGKFSGVIAQEVPWATISVNDYLFVDYSKVDVDFKKIS